MNLVIVIYQFAVLLDFARMALSKSHSQCHNHAIASLALLRMRIQIAHNHHVRRRLQMANDLNRTVFSVIQSNMHRAFQSVQRVLERMLRYEPTVLPLICGLW